MRRYVFFGKKSIAKSKVNINNICLKFLNFFVKIDFMIMNDFSFF